MENKEDPLFGLKATQRRAEQLGRNCNWLIGQIDIMHFLLCPKENGTWQQRTEQVVRAVKKLKDK